MRSISVTKKYEKIEIDGRNISVDIYANRQGIPHIISANDEDMFFAVGYFHASQRLWQICNMKILAEGRMAEFFGEEFLKLDLYMRTLELSKIANSLFENADDETKQILLAYSDGVNEFIKHNINRLSLEFGANNLLPEKWNPSDCFLIQRFWAFTMSAGFFNDIVMGNIASKIGMEKAMELIPSTSRNAPFILDDKSYSKIDYSVASNNFPTSNNFFTNKISTSIKNHTTNNAITATSNNLLTSNFFTSKILTSIKNHTANNEIIATSNNFLTSNFFTSKIPTSTKNHTANNAITATSNNFFTNNFLTSKISTSTKNHTTNNTITATSNNSTNTYHYETYHYELVKQIYSINSLLNKKGANLGSNTWASNKESGKTILANDSHLPLTIPCVWLQMHISSPNYNVIGMVIPGMPVFMSGRNDKIAWGVTNMFVDDVDYFIQKIDDKQEYYQQNDSVKNKIEEYVDTIKIRNKDDYLYYKRSINKSPIITDFLFINDFNSAKNLQPQKIKSTSPVLTMKWTGNLKTNEIRSLLKVMKADNWTDFINGVDDWNCPGMVFSYADIRGNIGIAPRAIIPIRAKSANPNFPFPYWLQKEVWVDYLSPYMLPTSYNPSKKFVCAANNQIARNFNHYITSNYAVNSRALRIDEMLNIEDKYSFQEAQYMQNDIFSFYARNQINKLKNVFKQYKHLLNKEETKAYYKLLKWDCNISPKSTAVSIYSMFLSKFAYNTFADELGELYHYYASNTNAVLRLLDDLIENPVSEWLDNVKTSEREYLDFIVIKSFKDAMVELEQLYGTPDSDKWRYGIHHTIDFVNSYNYYPFLNKAIDVDEFELAGNSTTINCNEWNLNEPFKVVSGTSMRFIADMGDDIVYMIMPGGTSGDPMHPNYSDQIKLWQIGAYVKLSSNSVPTSDFKLSLSIRSK